MRKLSYFCILFSLSAVAGVAATVSFQNLDTSGDNAHGLFDEGGALLPLSLTSNVQIGAFSVSGSSVQSLWDSGDLAGLNSAFSQFGVTGISIEDGIFQDSASTTISAGSFFDGKNITFFISNSDDFSSTANQFLIFVTDQTFGNDDSGLFTTGINLGEVSGNLLVGEQGNFSSDFGGGTALPGFNTVSVVPEPSAYAAIAGILALSWVMIRRRQ